MSNDSHFQHPADGWYQIEPKGEHPNEQWGVLQVIDDTAAQSIVNRFNTEANKPGFAGMLIDHEHFKHDTSKETTAYGWLMRLKNREDGIYGQVRWTTTGSAAVDGGDYRFFSSEFDLADLKVLNSGPPKKVRPMRLDGLTLTNDPNNKGGKPITNRRQEIENMKICNGHAVMERAYSLRAESPNVSLATCIAIAQRELKATEDAASGSVTNRANPRADEASLPGALSQEGAQKAFSALVSHLMREQRMTHENAYEKAKGLFPEIFAAMGGEAADVYDGPTAEDTLAAQGITNRAHSLMAKNRRASAHSTFRQAQMEHEAGPRTLKINNRASEIRKEFPSMPFSECFIQATREIQDAGE